MLKIEETEVYGWRAAIRGMRNPMNSWEQSDSGWFELEDWQKADTGDTFQYRIGEKDLALMKKLCKAGSDHRKYLRMITVYVDITAPLYWWKEADTYRIGKEQNSCSTMHKIHAKEFTLDDFSHEHLDRFVLDTGGDIAPVLDFIRPLEYTIECLNKAREEYLKTKDKKYWWQMIQLLPSSYNQKRTVMLNYEVLRNMYFARRNHKLDEWHTLCDWMEDLPYFREVCIDE